MNSPAALLRILVLPKGGLGHQLAASPQDLESMFQLIYLYAYSPRKDSTAFNSYRDRLKGYIENRSADPENALSDTIRVTLGDYGPWRRPSIS